VRSSLSRASIYIPLFLLQLFFDLFLLDKGLRVDSHAVLGPRSESLIIRVSQKLAPFLPAFLMPMASKVTCVRLSFPSSLNKLLVLSVPARVSAACLSSGANMACARLSKHQYSRTHEDSVRDLGNFITRSKTICVVLWEAWYATRA
jgi:hypothetical protein